MTEDITPAAEREPDDEQGGQQTCPCSDTSSPRKLPPKGLGGLAINQTRALTARLAHARSALCPRRSQPAQVWLRVAGVLVMAALLATGLFALTPTRSSAKSSPVTIIDLGALPGSLKSDAAAISPNGVAVGNVLPANHSLQRTQAVSYAGGVVTALGAPSDAVGTRALGINSSGVIVGYASIQPDPSQVQAGAIDSFQAVLFSNGTATLLGTLPGDGSSLAFAMNSSGQAAWHLQDRRPVTDPLAMAFQVPETLKEDLWFRQDNAYPARLVFTITPQRGRAEL